MNMGKTIKELRISKGLTQEELGAKIGVKKAAIMKYEKGIVENIKRSSIAKLADTLEVSPAYLMGWVDEPNEALSSPDDVIFTNGKTLRYGDLSIENQKKLEEYYFLLKAKEEGRI